MPYEITISGINTTFRKCIDWVTCKVDTPSTSNARSNYVGNYMNISGFIGTDELTIDLYQWAILPINDSYVCRNVQLTVNDSNDNVIEKISFPNAFVEFYRESYTKDKGLGKFDLQLKQRIDKNGSIAVSGASDDKTIRNAVESKILERVLGESLPCGILDTGAGNVGDNYTNDFEDLAAYRREQGMPVSGGKEDNCTAAKLKIGDNEYYGKNGHGKQDEVISEFNVNPQTATHAEGDVFYQAKNAGENSTSAVLITDRRACKACGFNGGIRSMAKKMGITDLTIISPGREPIRFNPQIKPNPNPFK